jgi:putative sigma-54 modulation protein
MREGDRMKINIRGDKVTVTKAIKDQVENKLMKLEKYFENPDAITAHVNIKINNLSQIIEVTIPTKKFTIRAEDSNEDLYAAIDLVVDKIERQIRKNKTKIKNKYKNTVNLDLNLELDSEEVEEANKIIKRKDMEMKPMDEEEALIQAELLGHDFFIFKNLDEECVSVLYKRKDSSYGIINVK